MNDPAPASKQARPETRTVIGLAGAIVTILCFALFLQTAPDPGRNSQPEGQGLSAPAGDPALDSELAELFRAMPSNAKLAHQAAFANGLMRVFTDMPSGSVPQELVLLRSREIADRTQLPQIDLAGFEHHALFDEPLSWMKPNSGRAVYFHNIEVCCREITEARAINAETIVYCAPPHRRCRVVADFSKGPTLQAFFFVDRNKVGLVGASVEKLRADLASWGMQETLNP